MNPLADNRSPRFFPRPPDAGLRRAPSRPLGNDGLLSRSGPALAAYMKTLVAPPPPTANPPSAGV